MPDTLAGAVKGLDAKTGRATVNSRTMYVGVATAAPTVSSTLATVSEYSGAGYARQAYNPTAPAGNPEVTSNTSQMTWGPFGTDPAAEQWLFLTDASSGTVGEITFFWAQASSRDPALGDSLQAAAGAITISES